jgi:hypothetical protein
MRGAMDELATLSASDLMEGNAPAEMEEFR